MTPEPSDRCSWHPLDAERCQRPAVVTMRAKHRTGWSLEVRICREHVPEYRQRGWKEARR